MRRIRDVVKEAFLLPMHAFRLRKKCYVASSITIIHYVQWLDGFTAVAFMAQVFLKKINAYYLKTYPVSFKSRTTSKA